MRDYWSENLKNADKKIQASNIEQYFNIYETQFQEFCTAHTQQYSARQSIESGDM